MKKLLIAVTVILLVIAVGYSAGIGYYAEKFQANTTFGNVDISNMSLTQAQQVVEDQVKGQAIEITENGQVVGSITLAELDPEFKTEEILTATYNNQNPNEWLAGYFSSSQYDNVLMDTVTFDLQKLNEQLNAMGLNNADRVAAKDAAIDYSESQGYYVTEAEMGNQLDVTQIQEIIVDGIQNGAESVEINQAYVEPTVENDDEKISTIMEQIETATNTQINLTIADQTVTIPQEEIEKWIYFDANNEIVYDQNLIYEYLGTLNDQYATYDKVRQFQSTLEGVVTVEPGTLGWSIDRETETQNIAADLYAGEDVTRQPAIAGSNYISTDPNDIGNSYVEVSVDAQTMWVYKDGQVVVETPIVTGQVGTDTVPGAYSVWDKEENSALTGYNPRTGADYVQPVDYWIPFDDTGQGIHDANWQGEFGGNVYQVSGSLGCINTPPGVMGQVFAAVELGMPVIVH